MSPEDRAILIADITTAIKGVASGSSLSEDEQRWVRVPMYPQISQVAEWLIANTLG
jgi:hypothetical protein